MEANNIIIKSHTSQRLLDGKQLVLTHTWQSSLIPTEAKGWSLYKDYQLYLLGFLTKYY